MKMELKMTTHIHTKQTTPYSKARSFINGRLRFLCPLQLLQVPVEALNVSMFVIKIWY